MSKLEEIVPPLEMCKRIPEGAFGDSALVWFGHSRPVETLDVVPRNELGPVCEEFLRKGLRVKFPAPTLAEIMEALGDCNIEHFRGCCEWVIDADASSVTGISAAAAALRLWLAVNGSE